MWYIDVLKTGLLVFDAFLNYFLTCPNLGCSKRKLEVSLTVLPAFRNRVCGCKQNRRGTYCCNKLGWKWSGLLLSCIWGLVTFHFLHTLMCFDRWNNIITNITLIHYVPCMIIFCQVSLHTISPFVRKEHLTSWNNLVRKNILQLLCNLFHCWRVKMRPESSVTAAVYLLPDLRPTELCIMSKLLNAWGLKVPNRKKQYSHHSANLTVAGLYSPTHNSTYVGTVNR